MLTLFLVPMLLLGGLESALRLGGYGYSTSLFRPLRISGHDYLVENDSFSYRFFPPELARTPGPLRMEPHKLAGTYRIFILGESAAMGDPEPAFAASRYLEALLRERLPNARFEIVNVAFTAINSHVILPVARECAKREGDLWIVYMGNNEMVGPFGAATVFGPKAPPLGFVRFSLAVQKTRIGQLLASLGRRLRSNSDQPAAWGGMQMFLGNRVAPASQARETVYRNFERNLRHILRTGQSSGAKILLNTVGVNLKDCPPFASLAKTNTIDITRFEWLYDDARRLEDGNAFSEAANAYSQAASLDPQFAEIQFRWANCLLQTGNTNAARKHFQQACDFDALPFRTDSRLNAIITRAATDYRGPDLKFIDAAEVLATNSPSGIAGQESFYEHVHLNFDGNYRLARVWAEAVLTSLPPAMTEHEAPLWASQELCERRLGLTDWNRQIVAGDVERRVTQPPLSSQFNNTHRLEQLETWKRQLQHSMAQSGAAARAAALYQEAIAHAPDDSYLHENFGTFLVAMNDLSGAAAQWQQARDLIPQDYLCNLRTGELLGQLNKPAEAEAALDEAAHMRPYLSDAFTELGKVYAGQGQYAHALEQFDHALKLQRLDYDAWFNSGIALSKLNRRPEAIERYRKATVINPGVWKAHFELGGQLGLEGKLAEAKQELEKAIQLEPKFAPAHLNLGVAFLKLNQFEDAAREFQETIRLDPSNRLAPSYLAQLEATRPGK